MFDDRLSRCVEPSYENVHEFISPPTRESISLLRGVRREPAASQVDRRERRNWIVILFSKAICKCYQKFSGHACYSRFATRLLQTRGKPPLFSPSVSFPFFFSRQKRSRRIHATMMLHLNFGFFNASRVETGATRESVTVSSFPKFRRRHFSCAFIGP